MYDYLCTKGSAVVRALKAADAHRWEDRIKSAGTNKLGLLQMVVKFNLQYIWFLLRTVTPTDGNQTTHYRNKLNELLSFVNLIEGKLGTGDTMQTSSRVLLNAPLVGVYSKRQHGKKPQNESNYVWMLNQQPFQSNLVIRDESDYVPKSFSQPFPMLMSCCPTLFHKNGGIQIRAS